MPADPKLAALPAIRRLAEDQAREEYEAYGRAYHARYPNETLRPWGAHHGDRDCFIDAQLALLSDLSRDASFAAAVRLIAARTYAKHGGRGGYIFGFGPNGWGILYDKEDHWCTFDEIPGMHGVDGPTNDVDALTIAALYILGATHD